MKTRIATIHVVACLIAAFAAVDVSARTVYDAGKAFNEAGHNVNTFGPWSLLHASGEGMTNTMAFDEATGESGSFAGIGGVSVVNYREMGQGMGQRIYHKIPPNF